MAPSVDQRESVWPAEILIPFREKIDGFNEGSRQGECDQLYQSISGSSSPHFVGSAFEWHPRMRTIAILSLERPSM